MWRRPRAWVAWPDLHYFFQRMKATTTTRMMILITRVGEV